MSGNRRLFVAAGVVGLLGAVAVQLWRRDAVAQGLSESASAALWGAEFQTPQGTSLKLADFKGKPLVINFWATWCPPCVEEIPLIDDFFRENSSKGISVVGLAVDQPGRVKRFVDEFSLSYPTGLAGMNGTELSKILGNESAALPFTIVLDKDGEVFQKKLGKLSQADIKNWEKLL